ncbi:hypothetical protein [Amycolatopsis sp.]|uniref:hypothetical protein n=1 Tax=Amycolatopsis sp. TaxID=37632 RepID=UPI002CA304DA|nr:hypothetical protein [Amycolatopsis sp.]HVV08490.1 hypothetical protein [Amycolatopsis sp.]
MARAKLVRITPGEQGARQWIVQPNAKTEKLPPILDLEWPRLKAAVAASTELQEPDALKNLGLAAAMTAALVASGVPDPVAHLAAEMGVLAFKRGYAMGSEGDRADSTGLAPHTLAALEDLRAAATRS